MGTLTVAEVLEWALQIEKNGEAFYTEAAAKSTDEEVKALLLDLAAQERGHSQVFSKMLEGQVPLDEPTPFDEEEYGGYLRAALDDGNLRAAVLDV